MTVRRILSVTLAFLLGALPYTASSQEVLLRAGPSVLASDSELGETAGAVTPRVDAGARFWLTDLFQVQGTIGYGENVSAEGALYVRPFASPGRTLEPYAFAGTGVMFGSDFDRQTTVPVGIGVDYALTPGASLVGELAGRWMYSRSFPEDLSGDRKVLDFSVIPSVGVSYRFGAQPSPYYRASRENWTPNTEPMRAATMPSETTPGPAADTTDDEEDDLTEPQRNPATASWQGYGQPASLIEDNGDQIRTADGTFVMGLTDEDPLMLQTAGLKRVTVSGFYLDKHEVSNAEYRAYLSTLSGDARSAATPDAEAWSRAGSASSFEGYFQSDAYADYPVVAVSWEQAVAFCEAHNGRLPTEAEWEYAARSGRPGGIYPWPGFEPRAPSGGYMANFNPGRGLYAADGFAFTAPVDAFPASDWGLHNMSGNAAEWVMDAYTPSYANLSNFNPLYEDENEARHVVRGGSWSSDAFYIGVGVRDAQPADEATIYTGFRCAYEIGADLPGQREDDPTTSADADDATGANTIVPENDADAATTPENEVADGAPTEQN